MVPNKKESNQNSSRQITYVINEEHEIESPQMPKSRNELRMTINDSSEEDTGSRERNKKYIA